MTVQAQYPQALVLEVKKSSLGTPISETTCNQWVSDFSITHTLLRDNGQVQSNLAMTTYDIIVMDRQLEIVYRGANAYSSTTKSAVLSALASLPTN